MTSMEKISSEKEVPVGVSIAGETKSRGGSEVVGDESLASLGSHARHQDHGHPGRKHALHIGMTPALCPVSGHCVSETGVHADTPQLVLDNGQRVFMCSTECLDQFRGDPTRFLSVAGERWTEAPDMFGLTVGCPECKATKVLVSDHAPRLLLKHGQTIWFNSATCMVAFLKNPSAVFQSPTSSTIAAMVGLDREKELFQVACPVTGKKFIIDKRSHFVEFKNGQRLYTCCDRCPALLAERTARYVRGLQELPVFPPEPSLDGLVQKCICCEHNFIIGNETTPRVQFHGGQNLYFSTNTCRDLFMEDPSKWVRSLDTAVPTRGEKPVFKEHIAFQKEKDILDKQGATAPITSMAATATGTGAESERFGEKTGGAYVTPVSGYAATGSGSDIAAGLPKDIEKLSIAAQPPSQPLQPLEPAQPEASQADDV